VRLPYEEGDWFTIPLPSGGHASGLVARAAKSGRVLLGYFFGPRRATPANLEELAGLTPHSAILVSRFGDLDLMQENWPILGQRGEWRRELWPMPLFVNRDLLSQSIWTTEYSDGDPNHLVARLPVSPNEAERFQPDRVSGSGAITNKLDHLLAAVRFSTECHPR
jgi:hypothetical protein